MYTKEILSVHPFFEERLKTQEISSLLDSLTGVLLRSVMIEYVHFLIDHRIPFTLAILDLDNFKVINDNYGHKVGDGVLAGVSDDLIRYLEDFGLAGRFGGDEFLIVNLRDLEYDDKKQFYLKMYADFNVMRKNVPLATCNPFITGTLGSATYPTDADNYDDLFLLADKTLYRGKTKGRNCYIIYLESKHKNIEIRKLTKHGLYTTFHNLAAEFDAGTNARDKLKRMYSVLEEDLRITNLYFITEDHLLNDIHGSVSPTRISDIHALMSVMTQMKEDIYTTNTVEELHDISPQLYVFLKKNDLETVLITRIYFGTATFGYLMCAEPHNLRIWQEDECAILFFAGRMLAGFMKRNNDVFL